MNKIIIVTFLTVLTACNTLPQLYQAAEDIADDIAVKIEISREAIQKETDITLSLDVKNKQVLTK